MIPLHKPHITGKEIDYIKQVIDTETLAGNGVFTKNCQELLSKKYGFLNNKLTNSCTHALDMASILLSIKPEDEVIVPSFTYVSSANPFVLRGAKIVFADSSATNPNIDPKAIPALITPKTKAILVMHYGGIACDMDPILKIANQHGILVVEDAAHSLGATYKERYLGGIGHLAAFSFHATKNITSGHGGLLVVNNDDFKERVDIIWEKGTNRKKFLNGEVNRYEWFDVGLSFYPSEITAAFLWAQLQAIDAINQTQIKAWNYYYNALKNIPLIDVPVVPSFASHNAHLFYIKTPSKEKRNKLLEALKSNGIKGAFHYLALHQSPFAKSKDTTPLIHAENWEDTLLRIPLFYSITLKEQDLIITTIKQTAKKWM